MAEKKQEKDTTNKHVGNVKLTVQDLKIEIQDNNDEFMFNSIGSDAYAIDTGHICFATIISAYRERFKPYLEKYGYEMVNNFSLEYAKRMTEISKERATLMKVK